jgi:hypothetical protein
MLALVLTAIAPRAWGVDLGRIDRSLVREPVYQTEAPRFALLVFGPNANRRVWLVADGDRLYVDRNGNGDLTERGEIVSGTYSDDGPVSRFLVRGLRAWNGKFAELSVRLAGETDFNDRLHLFLDGRPYQSVTFDAHGSFRFAERAEDAPIVHFGGPLQMALRIEQSLRRGTRDSIMTMIGTPGLGGGTFAALDYPRVPQRVHPVAEVEFPPAPGQSSPTRVTVPLDYRCCECNFQGDLNVPAELGPGEAFVTLTFPAWTRTFVKPVYVPIPIK